MAGGPIPGQDGDQELPAQAAAGSPQNSALLHQEQALQSHRGHRPPRLAHVLPRLLHQHPAGKKSAHE